MKILTLIEIMQVLKHQNELSLKKEEKYNVILLTLIISQIISDTKFNPLVFYL